MREKREREREKKRGKERGREEKTGTLRGSASRSFLLLNLKEWLMGGDAPSRADFVLHFFVGLAVQPGYVDLNRYPRVKAWMVRCEAREAWKRALEKGNGYDLNIPGQW